jgi:hypothetical protein
VPVDVDMPILEGGQNPGEYRRDQIIFRPMELSQQRHVIEKAVLLK